MSFFIVSLYLSFSLLLSLFLFKQTNTEYSVTMKFFLAISLLAGSVLTYITVTPSGVHSYPLATSTSLNPAKGSAILERNVFCEVNCDNVCFGTPAEPGSDEFNPDCLQCRQRQNACLTSP